MEPSKADWKLFRERIATWQETYMEKLIKEYMVFLADDIPASTKFWELEKRLKQDKKNPGVILNLSKSDMIFDLMRLVKDGVVTMDDLQDFSEEIKNHVKLFIQRMQ